MMQITKLQKIELAREIEQAEISQKNAAEQLAIFRLTEKVHNGDDDHALDTSYIEAYAKASARIEELTNINETAEVVEPMGDTIQLGSYVEVLAADKGLMNFIVVEDTFTADPFIKEFKTDAPMIEVILDGKVGDVNDYTVNGKTMQVAIGLVDNSYCADLADEILAEPTYSKKSNV